MNNLDTPKRNEYPRPQFVRDEWTNLNGEWDFSFDTDSFDCKITVPYAYQTKLSGIDNQDFHDVVWYRRSFEITGDIIENNKTVILHFGAVDYYSKLWINGDYVTEHTGGHISFEIDITKFIKTGENEIKLMVQDCADDLQIPRGKQFWEKKSAGIFYTRTTGIWQTVWLETINSTHLKKVWITPDLDDMSVDIEYIAECTENNTNVEIGINIYFEGREAAEVRLKDIVNSGKCKIGISQKALKRWHPEAVVWSPETPRLFDVVFTVTQNGEVIDRVKSYFGLRKVSIENGKFCLNNRPYYQKLLLDQGYWEDSLLTAPTDEDFIKDIELAKQMGFNGVRKHQKIEDPRYFYHADKMGFLVWGEIAAAYEYSREYVKRITDEWIDEINRDYNHPCIVAWTPINESWGVPLIINRKDMQHHSAAMLHITKSLDTTRPVISNDGWEHTCSDILTIHDYEYRSDVLEQRYSSLQNILVSQPAGRPLFANGWEYNNQPVIISEFGGISFKLGEREGWGYSNAENEEDFLKRYHNVVAPLLNSPDVQGFCYTQITDVEQEINGLLTYSREPKADLDIIKAINNGSWKPKVE